MQHALATLVATSSAAGLSTNSTSFPAWHSADRQPPGHEEPLLRLRESSERSSLLEGSRVCTLASVRRCLRIFVGSLTLMYTINNTARSSAFGRHIQKQVGLDDDKCPDSSASCNA